MRPIISIWAICLILLSCHGNSEKTTLTTDDGNGNKTTLSIDPKNATSVADEMNKKTEELKKLTPMTVDQIKAMLPEQLMGIKRSSFDANSMMGFATADADYKKNDTTNIKITVMDCAGEAGSSFYALNYWTKMTIQSENDQGFTKTIDFMGGKAVEDYKKYNNTYTLTFTANDRLLITLQGQNVTMDQLMDAAKSLNLKAT